MGVGLGVALGLGVGTWFEWLLVGVLGVGFGVVQPSCELTLCVCRQCIVGSGC